MMTSYKNNADISLALPKQAKLIFSLNYGYGDDIDCVVYDNLDDANAILSKIHQDINGGIGRKQWGAHEKEKDNAEMGNKSKTYALIEFVKQYKNVDKELLRKMNSTRWTSKLERVVGFSNFKSVYNITFDNNNSIIYQDEKEHVYKMLAKLIIDLITKSATGNFRLKRDFDKYVENLSAEFKTLVGVDESNECETSDEDADNNTRSKNGTDEANDSSESASSTTSDESDSSANSGNNADSLPPPKKIIKNKKGISPEALGLSGDYNDADRECLGDKGRSILSELERLDINIFPYASSALCRAMIEYTLSLWYSEYDEVFVIDNLEAAYKNIIHKLQSKGILASKRHSALSRLANRDKFIDDLNSWIHYDPLLCVRPEKLKDGWLASRILIELYLQKQRNKQEG